MAIAKIKTDEELARLDAIFAEIEAMERGEPMPVADSRTLALVAEYGMNKRLPEIAWELHCFLQVKPYPTE